MLPEFMDICSIISESGGYKFCLGIPEKKYFDEYYSVICYHIKSIRIWEIGSTLGIVSFCIS